MAGAGRVVVASLDRVPVLGPRSRRVPTPGGLTADPGSRRSFDTCPDRRRNFVRVVGTCITRLPATIYFLTQFGIHPTRYLQAVKLPGTLISIATTIRSVSMVAPDERGGKRVERTVLEATVQADELSERDVHQRLERQIGELERRVGDGQGGPDAAQSLRLPSRPSHSPT